MKPKTVNNSRELIRENTTNVKNAAKPFTNIRILLDTSELTCNRNAMTVKIATEDSTQVQFLLINMACVLNRNLTIVKNWHGLLTNLKPF